MPKITLSFNASQIIEHFCDVDDIVSSIEEYAPDFGFPDTADLDTVQFNELTYGPRGDAQFSFDYENEEEDEDEEEDDSQDPDGSEGEDL